MYPDLVRASRFDLYFQQRKLAVSAFNFFRYLPVCNGFAPGLLCEPRRVVMRARRTRSRLMAA